MLINTTYISLIALLFSILSEQANAAEKVVRLNVPACNCAIANAVVVGILEDVKGVRHARVNGMDSTATVFFDNTTTNVSQLRKALGKANILVEGEIIPLDSNGRCIVK